MCCKKKKMWRKNPVELAQCVIWNWLIRYISVYISALDYEMYIPNNIALCHIYFF